MRYIVRQPGCLILSWWEQSVVVVCESKDQAQDFIRSGLLGSGELIVEDVTEAELHNKLLSARSLGCQYVAFDPDPELILETGQMLLTPLVECVREH